MDKLPKDKRPNRINDLKDIIKMHISSVYTQIRMYV